MVKEKSNRAERIELGFADLRRQSLPALGPAVFNDFASLFGGHPLHEPVIARPPNSAGLIRSFHCVNLFLTLLNDKK